VPCHGVAVKDKAGVEQILYQPTAKQLQFHLCPARNILYGGAVSGGKAVRLSTPIPTPTGYRTMGELAVGDTVFDERGQPCTVTWKSDPHVDPSGTYRVTFDDESVIVAGGAHEWHTWTYVEREARRKRSAEARAERRTSRASRSLGKRPDVAARNRATAVGYAAAPVTGTIRTTAEIADTVYITRPGTHHRTTNHAIPLAGAWQCPEAVLPLDPYCLGVWLGDGSAGARHITTDDPEVLAPFERAGFTCVFLGRYRWSIHGLTQPLQAAGVWKDKHVPTAYLWASADQRLALLQGLMDSDGWCDPDGGCSFGSMNRGLAEAVRHLATSLGLKPHTTARRARLNGRDYGVFYLVSWTGRVPVFRLTRKAARLPTHATPRPQQRYITVCERISDEPLQCIEVDSPSHEYLVGDAGIPTHNSHGLRWDAHMACLSVPGIRVLILRRTFPELQDTHLDRVGVEASKMGAEYLKSEYRVRFPNGSVEQYGHCGDDTAVSRYLSTEYERIYFDELVTFTFRQFVMIGSRARSTKPGYIPRVLAATNPGGPHASWVREWFINKSVDVREYPTYRPEDYAYIPATLDDNPYIDAAVYEHRLQMLPPALREAYRYGSWDIFEGQYFKEWKARDHVRTLEEIPREATRFRALDWGYLRPGVCLWFVMLPDGHLYIEEEYVFSETIASEVAREIRRRSAGLKLGYTVADPAMWIREGSSGESIAETFARSGVPLLKADNARVVGWQRLRHWLAPAPDGTPWLTVSPRCAYLIRTLPSLLMDAHNPEDCDSDSEDHAADACRYGVQSRPHPAGAASRPKVKPGTAGALLEALRRPGKPKVGSTNARRAVA